MSSTTTNTNTGSGTSGNTTTNDQYNVSDLFSQIFSRSNVIILVWFLAIYLLLSMIVGIWSIRSQDPSDSIRRITRMFDLFAFAFVLFLLVVGFFMKTETEKEQIVENTYNQSMDFISTSVSILYVIGYLVVFYGVVYLVGIPMDSTHKSLVVSFMENGGWFVFALLLIVWFLKKVLNISLTEFFDRIFDDFWRRSPTPDVSGNLVAGNTTLPKSQPIPQVFNIANNIYTYDDAQAVCKAFDSRLATYDEIEKAYTGGGEWCNYGWSDNQSIYFPTQKSTWTELQKTTNSKNACGRPGINGGYIDNPQARFGVNCFGIKPKATESEKRVMDARKNTPVANTPEKGILDLKVQLFKDHRDELMQVNAFSPDHWSQF